MFWSEKWDVLSWRRQSDSIRLRGTNSKLNILNLGTIYGCARGYNFSGNWRIEDCGILTINGRWDLSTGRVR